MGNTVMVYSGASSANVLGIAGATLDSGLDDVSNALIFKANHPVGSVYVSADSTSPASLYGGLVGGTWSAIVDKFIVAAGTLFTAGSVYGAASVTLSEANIPAHTHTATLTNPTVTIGVCTDSTSNVPNPKNNVISKVLDSTNAVCKAFSATASTDAFLGGVTVSGGSVSNSSIGSGEGFSIIPPCESVYMWKRTA